MKIHRLRCWFVLMFLLVGCGDNDLLEPYFVENPRILAVKIQDPETRPGDTAAMRMLVGGKTIDQQMTATVWWGIDDAQPVYLGESDYTENFDFPISADALDGTQWYDLPVYARIQPGSKGLNTQKMVRITDNPVAKNPEISGVRLQYLEGGELITQIVGNGDTIAVAAEVTNIALTALTEDLPPGENDKLVYRWYVSLSKNSDGMLYIQREEKKIEAFFGDGAEASERRPSAVFSLRGEDNDKAVQTGIYDFYLVVRDNAENPQSLADERYGTDFLYFTLCVDSDC